MIGERELQDHGRFKGGRLLEFRKGEYELDVQHAGGRKFGVVWYYSIEVNWFQ